LIDKKHKKIPLHLQILIGMLLGIGWSITMSYAPNGVEWTESYIKPFGSLFIKLLQMLAIPLILTSIISGIAGLKDIDKLGRIGGRTLALFTVTCLLSTIIGIGLSTIFKPGSAIPEQTKIGLLQSYQEKSNAVIEKAQSANTGVMDMIVEIIPNNIFYALSNNGMMLQVVIFSLLFGIALSKV
jgi:proton glutamate symport protein